MRKRRYANMVALLPVIAGMLSAGISYRAIKGRNVKTLQRNIWLQTSPEMGCRHFPHHAKEAVLYLAMIWGLYDNSIVAYKTATQQTVNLVLDTIRLAMKKEKKRITAELQLHSDQGFPYESQAYFKLTQSYGITPRLTDIFTFTAMGASILEPAWCR